MEGRIFGVSPLIALAALGGAGLVGYLLFFRNQSAPSSGQGVTGFSPFALEVQQNPDESASIAEQNRLLSIVGTNVTNGFSSVGTGIGTLSGQVGTGFNTVSGQVASSQQQQQQEQSGLWLTLASIYDRLTANIAASTGSGSQATIAAYARQSDAEAQAALNSFSGANKLSEASAAQYTSLVQAMHNAALATAPQ